MTAVDLTRKFYLVMKPLDSANLRELCQTEKEATALALGNVESGAADEYNIFEVTPLASAVRPQAEIRRIIPKRQRRKRKNEAASSSSNGRTSDFDSENRGSSPREGTNSDEIPDFLRRQAQENAG